MWGIGDTQGNSLLPTSQQLITVIQNITGTFEPLPRSIHMLDGEMRLTAANQIIRNTSIIEEGITYHDPHATGNYILVRNFGLKVIIKPGNWTYQDGNTTREIQEQIKKAEVWILRCKTTNRQQTFYNDTEGEEPISFYTQQVPSGHAGDDYTQKYTEGTYRKRYRPYQWLIDRALWKPKVNPDARKFFSVAYYKSFKFYKPKAKDQLLIPPQPRHSEHFGKEKKLYKTLIHNKIYRINYIDTYANVANITTGIQKFGLEGPNYILGQEHPNYSNLTQNQANENEYRRQQLTVDPKHNYILYIRISIPMLADGTYTPDINLYPQIYCQTFSAWRDV